MVDLEEAGGGSYQIVEYLDNMEEMVRSGLAGAGSVGVFWGHRSVKLVLCIQYEWFTKYEN